MLAVLFKEKSVCVYVCARACVRWDLKGISEELDVVTDRFITEQKSNV